MTTLRRLLIAEIFRGTERVGICFAIAVTVLS
jgi:hypothetical protein